MEENKITWKNVKIKLSEVVEWEDNPKYIQTSNRAKLDESLDTFGLVETLAIGPANELYNGHQRLSVLMQRHGGDFEVDARRSSRELTEEERKQLVVFLHEGTIGSWDFTALGDLFSEDELIEWGFSDDLLNKISWDDEVDLGDFNYVPAVEIRYRYVLDNLELDEANDMQDQLQKGRVEQYRV